jgi:hypothetical protein
MPSLPEDLAAIKDPSKIQEARFASSPYVLRKAFERDPAVQRLIRAGRAAVPLVVQELRSAGHLDEITRACLVHILEHVDPSAVAQVVAPLLRADMTRPGPFFAPFATHALRTALKLPNAGGPKLEYAPAEMHEALNFTP